MKYIRILRLPDQYTPAGAIVLTAHFFGIYAPWLLFWFLAVTCLSICAFIINELVDRNDVDQFSWNKIHIVGENYNFPVVVSLILFFGLTGLAASFYIGLLNWALAILILGIAYSVKPLRLKVRFGLDMTSQLAAAWVLPILAVLSKTDFPLIVSLLFVFSTTAMIWAILLPYQLADFTADKKAGFGNTYTVLGLRTSILVGFIFGLIGIGFYFALLSFHGNLWTIPIFLLCVYILYLYRQWYHLDISDIERTIRKYVIQIKPYVLILFTIYMVIWVAIMSV